MEFGLSVREIGAGEDVAEGKGVREKDVSQKGAQEAKGVGQEPKGAALRSVAVEGNVLGEFAQVKITQKYINEGSRGAEFIYTFPLPDNASVCGFLARVGGRTVRGEVKERQEAFREYDDAVRRGDSAYLLESFRPNIFQASLGHAGPGEAIELEITYVQEVKIIDGEMRLAVPTVVAPRYIPGKIGGEKLGMGVAHPTDSVPDADFISPPIGAPDYFASINFQVDAGNRITYINSPSHVIAVETRGSDSAHISLAQGETAMDRDFILAVGVFEEQEPRCLVGEGSGGGHFAYATFTPELPATERGQGTEYIFLIDISGSMDGEKLSQAKNAINICLRNLTGDDTFNLAAFESGLHKFSKVSMSFSQQSLDSATAWVGRLDAMGGTEILPAVRFALGKSAGDGRQKVVLLFTDGQVGNEEEILKVVRAKGKNVRFYPIGIDTAVNTYFINVLAQAGNGWAEFIYPGENVADKVIRQFSRVNAAWLENISIEVAGVKIFDMAGGMPARLYDCEPTSLIFKADSPPGGKVVVRGRCGGQEVEISIDNLQQAPAAEVLERLWARRKLEELEAMLNTGNPRRHRGIREDIVKISEAYGIGSSLTSFVAVHERENKLSGLPETLVIPVSAPRGWGMFDSNDRAPMPSVFGCLAGPDSVRFSSLNRCSAGDLYDEITCMDEPIYEDQSCIEQTGSVPLTPVIPNPCISQGNPIGFGMEQSGIENANKKFSSIRQSSMKLSVTRPSSIVQSEIEQEDSYLSNFHGPVPGQARQGDVIRSLAARQNSDGSFGEAGAAGGESLLQTAEAVIAFATSRGAMAPYRNQVMKALEFLASAREQLIKDAHAAKLAYIALELSVMRKVIKASGPATVLELLAELKIMFEADKMVRELVGFIEMKDIENIKKIIRASCIKF